MRRTETVNFRSAHAPSENVRIRIWRDYPPSVATSSVINSLISAGPKVSLKLGSLFKGGTEDTADPSSISS